MIRFFSGPPSELFFDQFGHFPAHTKTYVHISLGIAAQNLSAWAQYPITWKGMLGRLITQ
jgi:hypothetical protein